MATTPMVPPNPAETQLRRESAGGATATGDVYDRNMLKGSTVVEYLPHRSKLRLRLLRSLSFLRLDLQQRTAPTALLCCPVSSHCSIYFIGIDCGIQEGYIDETTQKYYNPDAQFVTTGINYDISAEYKTGNLGQMLVNLRSLPQSQGIRNCYRLRPEQGNNYLIRAWFLYGNYDAENVLPRFDLYIDVNVWDTVRVSDASIPLHKEIMYVASTNYIHVCLLNTGSGTPFISSPELWHLSSSIYKSQTGCMALSRMI